MNKKQAIELQNNFFNAYEKYGFEKAKQIMVNLWRQIPATRWNFFTFEFWNVIDILSKPIPWKIRMSLANFFSGLGSGQSSMAHLRGLNDQKLFCQFGNSCQNNNFMTYLIPVNYEVEPWKKQEL
jgi:hypothetical protein